MSISSVGWNGFWAPIAELTPAMLSPHGVWPSAPSICGSTSGGTVGFAQGGGGVRPVEPPGPGMSKSCMPYIPVGSCGGKPPGGGRS